MREKACVPIGNISSSLYAQIHSPKKNGSSKKSHSGQDSRGISPDSQLTDVEDRDLSIRDGDGVLLFRNHISEAIPSGSSSPSSSHSSPGIG